MWSVIDILTGNKEIRHLAPRKQENLDAGFWKIRAYASCTLLLNLQLILSLSLLTYYPSSYWFFFNYLWNYYFCVSLLFSNVLNLHFLKNPAINSFLLASIFLTNKTIEFIYCKQRVWKGVLSWNTRFAFTSDELWSRHYCSWWMLDFMLGYDYTSKSR